MSEKLTFEILRELMRLEAPRSLWDRIQSDREAIRAEVTASVTEELLKDHFKIGEKTEAFYKGGWVKGVIACTDSTHKANVNVRRPPKTRPMTREERIEALYNLNRPITSFGKSYLEKLTNQTIDELCIVDCINTEVQV